MKYSIRGIVVILAIVMSLVAVQNVCAQTTTVEGIIDSIIVDDSHNAIVVGGIEIYGIPYTWLENKEGLYLEVGDKVKIEYYEHWCRDLDEYKNKAVSINDIPLHQHE